MHHTRRAFKRYFVAVLDVSAGPVAIGHVKLCSGILFEPPRHVSCLKEDSPQLNCKPDRHGDALECVTIIGLSS